MFDTPSGMTGEDQEQYPNAPKMITNIIQPIPLYVLSSTDNTAWFWTAAWLARREAAQDAASMSAELMPLTMAEWPQDPTAFEPSTALLHRNLELCLSL